MRVLIDFFFKVIIMNKTTQSICRHLSFKLFQEYDISENTVRNLVSNEDFINHIDIIKDDCMRIYTEKVKSFNYKQYCTKNINKVGWEKERCGYVLNEYANGIKEYCETHKYIHDNNKLNHEFVQITDDILCIKLTDKYKTTIMSDVNELLWEKIIHEFNHYFDKKYNYYIFSSENINEVNNILSSSLECFKSRYILKYNEHEVIIVYFLKNGTYADKINKINNLNDVIESEQLKHPL